MAKKKTKRVDSRRAMSEEQAIRWHRFHETGAPVSLAMLAGFIVLSSFVLNLTESVVFDGAFFRRFLLIALLMTVLSLAMGLYILAYEPKGVRNHLRGAVLLVTLLVMIGLVQIGVIHQWSPYLSVAPVMMTAIIMTIAYSQRTALGIGSFLALVSVLAISENPAFTRDGFGVLLASGSGMGIAILSLREIRTRSKLIEVCILAAVAIFVIIGVVGFWQGLPVNEVMSHCLWGSGSALGVGLLMQGLLPVIERLFGTATGLTLLDYSEANKPLLRRLALEAPGTFNHSWQLGMMAEAAAEAIDANGLLCRVGSYYHDIGKLNKPRYFVENQAELFNQHRELAPTMSRIIIIGHVKDGVELAREYRLPRVLHQFIATHHGTTLVEFFYHEAAKKAAEEGQDVVESEFRYPGPKPSTREGAIVMIADAVESATRAMKEPTPSRIENLVHDIALKRLLDRQFEECELTMKDLRRIEKSLVKSLCGMYHARIAYPKKDRDKADRDSVRRLENGSGSLSSAGRALSS